MPSDQQDAAPAEAFTRGAYAPVPQENVVLELDSILESPMPEPVRRQSWDGVFVAELTGLSPDGAALLSLPEMPNMPPARSTVAIAPQDVGRQAAVMFERGDVRHPLVIGLMHQPASTQPTAAIQARVDDDRLELVANREIVLRCGRASITLTRAGKVLIRGAYVSSRSSGANCIRGGSVQIN